jgi:hypothetical protein
MGNVPKAQLFALPANHSQRIEIINFLINKGIDIV